MKMEIMRKEPLHAQARRLYLALETIKGEPYTPTDVAKLLNVTQGAVTNWGTRGLPPEIILQIHEILGCSVMWLWKDVGDMHDQGPSGWESLSDTQRAVIQGRIDQMLEDSNRQKNKGIVTNSHTSKTKKTKKTTQRPSASLVSKVIELFPRKPNPQ
ncbi:MAG: helix-turn-helix transcriptional regulator [Burkholderiales bacterium]|nr:helix-turn-helix transcriptional regulator [Burkholderiales bacterium]